MRRFLFLLVLLPTAALADGFQVFVEGGAVKSRAASANRSANDAALTSAGFTVISSNESTSGSTLLLGVGYAWRRFAAEIAYVDLGQLHHYSGSFTAGANSGNQVKEWEASGIQIAARGSLPLVAGFALEGKLGLTRLTGTFRTKTVITGPAGSSSSSNAKGTGTLPLFGAGLSYAVTEELSVRGMYERWADKSGVFGDGNDLEKIQLFSIGALYRF
jgi:hypothetical protein